MQGQRPAEEGNPGQLALRHEAPVAGKRGDEGGDVDRALVVGHEHVGAAGLEAVEALGLDADPTGRADPAHPLAPDPEHPVPASVRHRDSHGKRGPEDRVEHDEQVPNDVDHAQAPGVEPNPPENSRTQAGLAF